MPTVSLVLAAVSFTVLVLGMAAWRLVSSRALMINVFICSIFLLLGAYAATGNERPEFAWILPFFATMLLTGRAYGFLWRSRKEPELRAPGSFLAVAALLSTIGAIMAYRHLLA